LALLSDKRRVDFVFFKKSKMNPTTLSVFLFLNFKGAKNFAPEEEKVEEKKKKEKALCDCCHRETVLGENPQGLAENLCKNCSSVYKEAEEQERRMK